MGGSQGECKEHRELVLRAGRIGQCHAGTWAVLKVITAHGPCLSGTQRGGTHLKELENFKCLHITSVSHLARSAAPCGVVTAGVVRFSITPHMAW